MNTITVKGPAQVSYIGGYIDPAFEQTIAVHPAVSFMRIPREMPFEQARERLAATHVLQIDSARNELPRHYLVEHDLLAHSRNLLVVSANGAGCDTIDIGACTNAGVIVVNQAGGNREAVGEHTLGMMLALTKRIGESDKLMRAGAGVADRFAFMGDDLYGKTVGLVGFGQVGTRVAELCRGLFAMTVLAFDPYVGADAMAALGARKTELAELLRSADFVSLHCPLNAETRHMIGEREFAQMRKGAYFLSTARGGIHDERALFEALSSGHLAGAGLDVWEKEPPDASHPLLSLPNVIASPHTAGVTRAARRTVALMAAEQIATILGGGRPPRLMNPEAWPRFRERFAAVLAS